MEVGGRSAATRGSLGRGLMGRGLAGTGPLGSARSVAGGRRGLGCPGSDPRGGGMFLAASSAEASLSFPRSLGV